MQSDTMVVLHDGRHECKWILGSGEKCGKTFGRKGDWVRHNRIHLNEKPYACSVCGRGFTQGNARNIHMNSHTGQTPYKCTVGKCMLSFSDPSSRSRHYREQHSPFGNHKFMCPVRGCRSRGIKRRSAFVAHLKQHGVDPATVLDVPVCLSQRGRYQLSVSPAPTNELMIQPPSQPSEMSTSDDIDTLSLDPRILLNGHASTAPHSLTINSSYDQPHFDSPTVTYTYERTTSPCTGYAVPTTSECTSTPSIISNAYDRTPSPFNSLDPMAISLPAPPSSNLLSASFFPFDLNHNINIFSSPVTCCSSLQSLSPSPIPMTPPSLNAGSEFVDFATSEAWFQEDVWDTPASFEKQPDFPPL